MRLKEYEDFQKDCLRGFCQRQTIYNIKTCKTESKQSVCYKKFIEKFEKNQEKLKYKGFTGISNYDQVNILNKDYKWEELKQFLKERDITCLANKTLTADELVFVEKQEGYWLNNRYVDGAHIIPRSQASHLIYDVQNVILLGRFFHSRLDNLLDLVTGEFIGQKGKEDWITRIMQHNKLWDMNYDYQMFLKDKMEV